MAAFSSVYRDQYRAPGTPSMNVPLTCKQQKKIESKQNGKQLDAYFQATASSVSAEA